VNSGACSLKSDPHTGDFVRAQIQYSAVFQAGTVSFARRVTGEARMDCLRFSIDGVDQDIGMSCNYDGDVPWGSVSVPISKGTHTLRWSLEKQYFGSNDSAAWIDDVALPSNHSTGPLPVPGPPSTFTFIGGTSFMFEYSAPIDDGGSPIIGYVARWRLVGESGWDGELRSESLPSPFELLSLSPGPYYEVSLSAINANGEGEPAITQAHLKEQCFQESDLFSLGSSSYDFNAPVNTPSLIGFVMTITASYSLVDVSLSIEGDSSFTVQPPASCEGLSWGTECAVNVVFTPSRRGLYTAVVSAVGTGHLVRCNSEDPPISQSQILSITAEGLGLAQEISLDPVAKTYGDPPFPLQATATSGLPIVFGGLTDAVCAVSSSIVTILSAGTCNITANQSGNDTYNPAPQVMYSFNVAKADQAIAFTQLSGKTFGDPAFAVSATVNSPLPVSFSTSTPGVCSVTGSTVTIIAAGTCTINANQSGSSNYNPAPQVSQSFAVAKAAQAVTFNALANKTIGDPAFTVSATASSNLAVIFGSVTPSTCTLAGTTVTLVAVGICTIAANQPGDANYLAAAQVTRSFQVGALGTFALAIVKAGTGIGTVVSSVPGIDCGATCSFNFTSGTALTLTATPAAGSTFAGWSGACTGTGPCSVMMSSAIAVTATFTLNTRLLTVTKAGDGSVTSNLPGIDCGSACSFSFTAGTTVLLTATPAAGSVFVGWGGACSGVGSCMVAMDDAKAVSATFDGNPARMINISTRGKVLAGEDVMIGGFVIEGSAAKTVAIVASGPSLAAFGIANPLANPKITLVRSSDGATIATNDDWGSAANAAQIAASGFAPANALEPAILMSLQPGGYTAIVSGAGGETGVALVAVYELDRHDVPLVNISTRGKVLTGDDVMIGGFVIQGSGPQEVAIVVTGPSLAAFGIANPLADPTITLVRASDGAVIAANDNWGSASNAPQIQASGFAPSHPLEPAVLVTLQPGAYTAIVSGVGGVTGVALVAVYSTQ
jgi:hypothetical protein